MWVAVAVGVLAALTALALSVPVDLDLEVEVHGRSSVYVRVEWLFGRVSKTVRAGEGGAKAPKAAAANRKKEGGRGRRTRRAGGRLAWDLVHISGLLRSVVRLVVRLIRCIRVKTLSVDFRAGLGDPADTAMIVGAASQAALFADLWSPYSFRLVPEFGGEPLLDGRAEFGARLRPIRTVPPLLAFLFAPSTIKVVVLLVRSRWTKDD